MIASQLLDQDLSTSSRQATSPTSWGLRTVRFFSLEKLIWLSVFIEIFQVDSFYIR
jgi:hypothetical protein